MPRDEWKIANDRAKYGPPPMKKPRKKRRRKTERKAPPNFRRKVDRLFAVYAGTPITVIRPNGTTVAMRATKNLRFGSEAKEHRVEGSSTFKRYGYYLIVKQELVGWMPSGP